MSNAILHDKTFYLDVYYVPTSFELFEQHVKSELSLRGLQRVTPSRLKRLFNLYTYIVEKGRIVWNNDASVEYLCSDVKNEWTSHHVVLRDIHVLESVGLVFRRGESMKDGRCVQYRELYPRPHMSQS